LGVIGFVVAGAMLVLGTWLAIDALRRGFTPAGGPPPPVFFAVPMFDMFAFLGLLILGWGTRKRAGFPKSFMLLCTAALLDAAVARIPLAFVQANALPVSIVGADIFVVAVWIYDFATKRRIHPATLVATAIILASDAGRVIIGGTAAWQHFALW